MIRLRSRKCSNPNYCRACQNCWSDVYDFGFIMGTIIGLVIGFTAAVLTIKR